MEKRGGGKGVGRRGVGGGGVEGERLADRHTLIYASV